MSTNIITVRKYPDASISVSINGREVPDCRVAVRDSQTGDVYLKVGCGSFTELNGDEERNEATFVDPELAELRGDKVQVPPTFTLVEPKLPWYSRFMRGWLR